MCLLFGTFPQKESKIKVEDRVGNLIETPKSEGKGKTKCPRRRGSGSVYIRFKIRHHVLTTSHIHQIDTKFNVSTRFVSQQMCKYGKAGLQKR